MLGSSELELTLTDTTDSSDISFKSKAQYGTDTVIVVEIFPKEIIYGGDRSVLDLDFKNKVQIDYWYQLLNLDDLYSIELLENPTNHSLGYMLGIIFHALFVVLFLGLCVIIIADIENICMLTIMTMMQRLYAIFLLNTRFAPFLATFVVQLGLVNFKTVYFEWLFLYQIKPGEIALTKHDYNSLGWFGYSSKNIIYNSAGALSFILLTLMVYLCYLALYGLLKC